MQNCNFFSIFLKNFTCMILSEMEFPHDPIVRIALFLSCSRDLESHPFQADDIRRNVSEVGGPHGIDLRTRAPSCFERWDQLDDDGRDVNSSEPSNGVVLKGHQSWSNLQCHSIIATWFPGIDRRICATMASLICGQEKECTGRTEDQIKQTQTATHGAHRVSQNSCSGRKNCNFFLISITECNFL